MRGRYQHLLNNLTNKKNSFVSADACLTNEGVPVGVVASLRCNWHGRHCLQEFRGAISASTHFNYLQSHFRRDLHICRRAFDVVAGLRLLFWYTCVQGFGEAEIHSLQIQLRRSATFQFWKLREAKTHCIIARSFALRIRKACNANCTVLLSMNESCERRHDKDY